MTTVAQTTELVDHPIDFVSAVRDQVIILRILSDALYEDIFGTAGASDAEISKVQRSRILALNVEINRSLHKLADELGGYLDSYDAEVMP